MDDRAPVFDEPGWMERGPDALDDGIIGVVKVLRAAGVDTYSSCQGAAISWATVICCQLFVSMAMTPRANVQNGSRLRWAIRSGRSHAHGTHGRANAAVHFGNCNSSWALLAEPHNIGVNPSNAGRLK